MASRIRGMNKTGGQRTPESPGADSWTDETLPLALRKELLDRELQKFIARKKRGESASAAREGEREPDAQRTPGTRRSDRPA